MKLEEYVLIKLMEECAEVQHICSKILRFGRDNYHPSDDNKTSNADLLNSDLYDLINAVQRVIHIVPGVRMPYGVVITALPGILTDLKYEDVSRELGIID